MIMRSTTWHTWFVKGGSAVIFNGRKPSKDFRINFQLGKKFLCWRLPLHTRATSIISPRISSCRIRMNNYCISIINFMRNHDGYDLKKAQCSVKRKHFENYIPTVLYHTILLVLAGCVNQLVQCRILTMSKIRRSSMARKLPNVQHDNCP